MEFKTIKQIISLGIIITYIFLGAYLKSPMYLTIGILLTPMLLYFDDIHHNILEIKELLERRYK